MKNVDMCAASLMTLALAACAAQAAVIVVPTQQPNIQAAINAAGSGDTVLVLDGAYSGVGNYDIDFLGKNITLQSMSGPDNCTIDVQATQQNQHGAFYLHSGETSAAVIQGFTVTGGLQFNGAGMMLFNSSPTVRNCVFIENTANCWGGVIYFDGNASPAFTDCKFIDNYSADEGGVVFGFEGSPTFTNCLFANNTAPGAGGAILSYGFQDAPRLTNCTMTANQSNWGGAIYSNNIIIENSIIYGNSSNNGQINMPTTHSVTVRYSNVQGGFTGEGNVNVAPQFVAPFKGDFHLMPGSACIDAGDPATFTAEGTTDLDGDPRTFGSRIDMGIDEFRTAGDVTGDHAVNVDDLIGVIVAWGPCTWSTADLDHNFAVNVDDLVTVIMNWS